MIPLSLVLVVVSATTLAIGVFTSGDALVWTSLGAGLGAVALVAGSVVRRRTVAPAGPLGAGGVGSAPAGPVPAPPPAPTRTPEAGPPPPPLPLDPPVQPPPADPRADTPADRPADGAGVDPWAPPVPTGPARGWSGHVPAVRTAPPRPADQPDAGEPYATGRPGAGQPGAAGVGAPAGSPAALRRPDGDRWGVVPGAAEGTEAVAVRDALRVAQLDDEVLVEDGRPLYHLAGCPTLTGAGPVPLPVSVARRGGFAPCGTCTPDRTLLARAADRRPPAANPPAANPPAAGLPAANPPAAGLPAGDPRAAGPSAADPPVAGPPTTDPPAADPPVAGPPVGGR